jgi:CRISPR-associated protein Cpf1
MSLNNTKEKSVFDEFTNKYALSKTLRFELKPEGKTSEMLEEANVFEKDHIIHEKYELTKPYLDRLHREFIKESLAGKKIDNLADYWAKFEAHYKNKKVSIIKKDFQNKEKELRKQLNNNFQTQELFSENVFGLLKEKYSHEEETFVKNEVGEYVLNDNGEKISIFDEWKGFVGYFTKFHETRKNFYKDDGTATAIVTRIVDENLYRFCENILHYKEIKNKNLINFTEVEEKLHVKLDNVFSLEYYNNCFLQEGIDVYNAVLGGKTLETGEKLKGVNELINKYRQDHKGEKINFFKKLDRQILSDKERPDFIKSIKDDKELLVKLKEFYANAEEKTIVAKKLLGELFTENNTFDLSKIYLSKEGLNTILFKWMNPEGKQAFETAIFEQNKKTKLVKIEDGIYKFPDFTALSFIKQGLNEGKYTDIIVWKERYYKTEDKNNASIDKDDDRTLWQQFIKVFKYEFDSLFEHVQCEVVDKKEVCSDVGYDIYKTQFEKLLARDEADFSVKNEDKLTIKNFVDNTLWIYQMTKYFAIEKKTQVA